VTPEEDHAKAILLLTKLREVAYYCFTFPGFNLPPEEKRAMAITLAEVEAYLDTHPRRLP
jgi:hypothetical protein